MSNPFVSFKCAGCERVSNKTWCEEYEGWLAGDMSTVFVYNGKSKLIGGMVCNLGMYVPICLDQKTNCLDKYLESIGSSKEEQDKLGKR